MATLADEIIEVWNKPFRKTSVCKDLPRLAGRVVIEASIAKRMSAFVSTLRLSKDFNTKGKDRAHAREKSKDDADNLEEIPEDMPPDEATQARDHIRTAIIEVARNLETKDHFQTIKKVVEAAAFAGDLELEMRALFNIIGEESKTAKLFKVITQNVLFAGCVEIKKKIPMHTMTKDVRGPEGWKILVSFTQDTISVSHYRREQSLANAPETEQFWFGWRLCIIFDKDMASVQSTSLKITNLGFGDKCSGAMRASLRQALGAGNLLVS